MSKTIKPFGEWSSPLSVEALATHSPLDFSQLKSDGNALYWVEGRAAEGGRRVIVRHMDGEFTDMTPADYSVSSSVHEYGGNAYCVADDSIYFVNAKDQNLYAQTIASPSSWRQITRSDTSERFVDPIYDSQSERIICVRETHEEDEEATNDLVSISIQNGSIKVLHQGHDFYANARLSQSGKRLAFLSWDHPNMPWNGTQLYVLDMVKDGEQASIIAGGQDESVFGPQWMNDDLLVYSSDRSGSYDLYAFSEEGTYTLAADEREYGQALWQVGSNQFHPLDDRVLLAAPDQNQLVLIDTFNFMQTPLESGATGYRNAIKHQDGIAFIQSNWDAPTAIKQKKSFTTPAESVKASSAELIPNASISGPERIEFIGSQNETVHAYFYGPRNEHYSGPPSDRPPLLVKAHGGPTGSTSAALSANIQFYTTRGWAVLDVNYSGSTGYGRQYRDRLLNEWGNRDVVDLVAGVRHLITQDLIDPLRVAITGSSAGGYTVLRALTTSSVFKVGASHYGIGDLRALASDTHKFESRYIDQLVPSDEIDERSPINHISDLNCPVIFSQGMEDKIVPPNQAVMMYKALNDKGIPTALLLHEEERHGFRKLETVMKTIKADYFFFSRVFNFIPDDIDESAFDGAQLANMASI